MNNIKFLRERNSISQQTLSEKVGVSQQAVAKWETGASMPGAAKLPLLADALSCTIDELFGRVPPGPGNQTSA